MYSVQCTVVEALDVALGRTLNDDFACDGLQSRLGCGAVGWSGVCYSPASCS